MNYSPSELIKNCWSLLVTKIFFRGARLVRRPIYIRGRRGIVFGRGFTTGYRCRFDIFGEGVKLTLGSNCKIGDNVHIVASEKVDIGENCLMASHIFISDTNHGDSNADPTTPPDDRQLVSSPVSIGKNVWIGEGACILAGTKIGDGCIIGAHAVVKGEIPDYSIAVGSPARVVKRYNFENKAWEKV